MPDSTNIDTESIEPHAIPGESSFVRTRNKKGTAERFCDRDNAPRLRDIDFVEPVGEPRSLDLVHRHELIQGKMATWRQIFLDGLTRQICLARDSEFRYPRRKFVERDGIKRREIVYVAPEPWSFERDGVTYLRLNFGERHWCVKGKNPVIRIGSIDDLLPTLEKLHILTSTGEFDEIVEKMVIVSQR